MKMYRDEKMKILQSCQKGGDTTLPLEARELHAVTMHFFSCQMKGKWKLELKGISYLRSKLSSVKQRVDLRYKQYAMQHQESPIGITIPAEIRRQYQAVLGWCAKGVDSLADRLVFREFANDDFEVNDIFRQNNPDVFFDSVVLSALIGACSFVYVSKGEDGEPRLQVIEASNATGILSPITGVVDGRICSLTA